MYMSSVSYRFLVSGNEVGPITHSRGLRQGDPISPYLFLLCAEGLSALIHKKQVLGAIHSCKIANGAPIVTHLFFTDDCYLFFRATVQEAESIKECLVLYERASGQQINFRNQQYLIAEILMLWMKMLLVECSKFRFEMILCIWGFQKLFREIGGRHLGM